MTEKLDTFEKDILSFLQKREPERVLWREIAAELFPSYKFNYKDERVFGVALTRKLNLLKRKGLIIKVGDFYGTPKSKSTTAFQEKKPNAHFNYEPEKPSKFGFFGWLKWKREYNDLQLDREIRELDSEFKTLLEQAQLNEDDSEFLKKCEEIEDKYKRKYGLA